MKLLAVSLLGSVLGLCLSAGVARAQAQQGQGFQLNRYEPTPAGEWSFGVDHPWYSRTRDFAAGFTLNYGHNPLVYGLRGPDGEFTRRDVVIEHALLGHFDFGLSLWDRLTLSVSMPITFLERGQTVAGVGPIDSAAFGDPRLGLMVRLYGQPDEDAFSVSLGGYVWVPIGADRERAGDRTARVLPKLVLAGLAADHFRWSVTGGFYYRPEATLGTFADPTGGSIGPSIQLGALLQYANFPRRFAIGPELILHTTVTGGNAFKKDYTSLELLLGAHYNIGGVVQTGLAIGVGTLRDPGTPDFRLLLRLAYAPLRSKDRDGDGVPDKEDACPDVRGPRSSDARLNGCPQDRDGDLVLDADDLCPDEPKGPTPDPARRGCPLRDTDGDLVPDPEDLCPTVHQGARPDPTRRGCPAGDRDGDIVLDPDDLCPDVPQGLRPDPARRGCPVPDRDGDIVPDPVDACPDVPGMPSKDPRKNGCPGKVLIEGGKLNILEPVYFATDRDVILPRSFPVLQAVADVLLLQPELRKISVEGHTDSKGAMGHNMDLSERRAKSVVRWLVKNGISNERLEAKGYGPTNPITTNDTAEGRQRNRRVEFIILDPRQ